ncbi:thiamine phosphate synthase [Flavobacterium jejuense]|uniref:Thiamine-phosphate synthase n=1 Tax=Flavobacterium jejuense TaxID=1544455 RepID=A0ABX0IWL5_9FLAO|nr:thiamine phosphate synthase [Flavobacterium jejuense]NHN27966.1 thiamine phosphate synthase [Flavobacterium jejuense]
MISKLHYISQGNTVDEQLYNIEKTLDNGCDWIQLRFKNGNYNQLLTLAEKTKQLCSQHKATFIINDKVDLAYQMEADGVHLGLDDMQIKDARAILGNQKIIGGTANTLEHILQRVNEKCGYIGLGPFRFTTTKEKLSPILGLEGYQTILNQMKENNISTPLIAIGGIQVEDVSALLKTGIHGIAVSGLLTQNPTITTTLNEKLYVNI